jgi:hypothetical protein
MHHSDNSHKTNSLTGQLCLFKESGLRCIVEVKSTEQQKDIIYTTLLLKAVNSKTSRSKSELLGTEITVSALKEGMWNQIWMIYPLNAKTVPEAILEADPEGRHKWTEDGKH